MTHTKKAAALIGLAVLLSVSLATADSFTIYGADLLCNEYHIIAWPDAHRIPPPVGQDAKLGASSGPPPTDNYAITATEIVVEGADTVGLLAVIGKLDVVGTGGDYISPRLTRVGGERQTFLPGREPIFRAGDELHIHVAGGCTEDRRSFTALATIYFERLP